MKIKPTAIPSAPNGALGNGHKPRSLTVGFVAGKTKPEVTEATLTWEELTAVLTGHEERRLKDGPGIVPAAFHEGHRYREADNVREMTLFVFDMDDGTPWEEVRPNLAGLAYVAYSSFSHSTEHPKYRVAVPLSRPVPAAEWADTWRRLVSHLSDDRADLKCKNLDRLYYLPACPVGAEPWFEVGEGEWLDASEAPSVTPAVGTPRKSDGTHRSDPYLVESLRRNGLDPRRDKREPDKWYFTCPWREHHTSGGATDGPTDAFVRDGTGEYPPLAHCAHRCHESNGRDGRTVDLYRLRAHLEELDLAAGRPRASYHLTDDGNANRFDDRHGKNLRWCPELGWLAWNGVHWARGAESVAVTLATETITTLYADSARMEDPDLRKALANHALKSEAAERLMAMVKLARHKPRIRAEANQFDADPWKLTCQNATINLRTGEVYAPRPEDLITRVVNTSYLPGARCPLWLQFLERVAPDPWVREYLKRLVGYSLTGDTREKCFFILHGPTDSGKTTWLETIGELLGTYAESTSAELLLVKRDGAIPNDLARLKDARFVWTSETEEGRRLATALVKAMTGRDKLNARLLYKEWFGFKSTFKIVFATNHKPVVRETSDAAWDRVKLVSFPVSVPEAEQIKDLPDLLRTEYAGILNWALEGLRKWLAGGLGEPDSVRAATRDYRQEMDLLTQFLEERCGETPLDREPAKHEQVSAGRLHRAYVEWCRLHGESALSLRRFGESMTERGIEKKGTEKGVAYVGLWLRPE